MKKIIPYKDIVLKNTEEEVIDILVSLREDYEIPVRIKKRELKVLLEEFYNYYESKSIQYAFYEMMTGHMEDIAITAVEEDVEEVDINFILKEMKLLELLDSPIEVIPPETKRVIQKIKSKLERGESPNERKRH